MLRTYRDRGIILRTYKLGEADRIVVLLGQESGVVRAVAKGVRKPTSRFGGSLEAFNLVDLQLYRGKNLDTITQAQLSFGYAGQLGSDYEAFTAAKVLVETTQKLTEDLAAGEPETFALLHGALAALAARRYPADLVASSFLLRLMRLAGWDPVLEECASCAAPGPHRAFSAEAGGAVCSACLGTSRLECGHDALLLAADLMIPDWDKTVLSSPRERAEVRALAGVWAQYHLEQRLRSLPFLQAPEESREFH